MSSHRDKVTHNNQLEAILLQNVINNTAFKPSIFKRKTLINSLTKIIIAI